MTVPIMEAAISSICDLHDSCALCPLHVRGFCKDHCCNTTPELGAFLEKMRDAPNGSCEYCGTPLEAKEVNNILRGNHYCDICWDKIGQLSPIEEVTERLYDAYER